MINWDECLECILNRVNRFADNNITGEELREIFRTKAINIVKKEHSNPVVMEAQWTRIAKEILGVEDIFKKEKKYFNDELLKIEEELENTLTNSDDILRSTLKGAIVGNIIDFGPGHKITLEIIFDMVKDIIKKEINIDIYEKFKKDLSNAKKLVYLSDNAGEVIFDKIFIKTIHKLYPNIDIVFITRGAPISSDITEEDAYGIGIDKYAKIINNGTDYPGTYLPDVSEECRQEFTSAEMIISKGQGNYESLIGCGYNVYYVLLCKCDLFAKILDINKFDIVFNNELVSKVNV